MVNYCVSCGEKLTFFKKRNGKRCSDCSDAFERMSRAQLPSIKETIKTSHECTPVQQEMLKTCDLGTAAKFYYDISYHFGTTEGFSEQDLDTLLCVQNATGLTDEQTHQMRQSALDQAHKARLISIEESIYKRHTVTKEQLQILKKYGRGTLLNIYFRLYKRFTSIKEPDEHDIAILMGIQRAFGLRDNEARVEEFIRPYVYVNTVRNEQTLPTIDLNTAKVGRPILRRGEFVHYAYKAAVFTDMKSASVESLAGVQGINFRVTKGTNYQIKMPKGAKLSVPSVMNHSYGFLVITNKRIFLHPEGGQAPVSINFNRVLNFSCYNNGILIWIEGRQAGYFFLISNSGAVEIFGLCLMFLLDAESSATHAKTRRSPFRTIPTEVKQRVLERDGGRCVMCGSSDGIHFDHIIPVAKGGDNTEQNIQLLCKECNLHKSDKII